MVKEKEVRHIGWQPMPTILKVIFIILIIGVVFSLPSLSSVYMNGYSLLGFYMTGFNAVISLLSLNILGACVILLAFWKRYSWAAKYAMVYYIFFIMNGILSISNIPEIIESLKPQLVQSGIDLSSLAYTGALMGIIFGVIINAVFLFLIFIKRDYFD